MDGKRFDELSRRFATRQSRRTFFGLIGTAAAGALTHQASGAAPKEDKPTKCYGEGSRCTNGKQCCSSHHASTGNVPLKPGQNVRLLPIALALTASARHGHVPTGSVALPTPRMDLSSAIRSPAIARANVCNGFGGVMTIADDPIFRLSPTTAPARAVPMACRQPAPCPLAHRVQLVEASSAMEPASVSFVMPGDTPVLLFGSSGYPGDRNLSSRDANVSARRERIRCVRWRSAPMSGSVQWIRR